MTIATLPNVEVPAGVWTNVYTLSGITSGSQVVIFNRSSYPIFVAHSATQPVTTNVGVPLLENQNSIFASSTMGLWVFCTNKALISVQTNTMQSFRNGSAQVTHAHTLGMPFDSAVALNLVPGARRAVMIGVNPDIDTGTVPEDLIPQGGFYPWPSATSVLQLKSTSVNDTAAGTGARTVLVLGLDSAKNEIQETVTLNGITGVNTVNSYSRVQNMLITSAGSTEINAGDIDIYNAATPANILHRIPAGYGIGKSSHYTVPTGWTLLMNSLLFCINKPTAATDATVVTVFRNPSGYYRMPLELSISSGPYRHDSSPPIPSAEGMDIVLRSTFVNQNNSSLTGAWSGVIYQNSAITAL